MTTAQHCSICGHRGDFSFEENVPPRDNFRCQNCRAMTRQRDIAQMILDEFGQGTYIDLRRFVESETAQLLSIYEVGITGPITTRLSNLENYTQSYYWEDTPLGEEKNGIRCEDLRNLTFADNSFDLVISLEILEHVFNAERALSEIHRVLKTGGVHIFSIPVQYPLPQISQKRAHLENGEIKNLLEPRYHVAGDGSKSLVVTDWGKDIIDLHKTHGLDLKIIRRSAPSVQGLGNASFIARKL